MSLLQEAFSSIHLQQIGGSSSSLCWQALQVMATTVLSFKTKNTEIGILWKYIFQFSLREEDWGLLCTIVVTSIEYLKYYS